MENGDDSTTLSVYLVSLNYTLKMVKLAKKDKEKALRAWSISSCLMKSSKPNVVT